MDDMFRHCRECGEERLFEQHHPVPGDCPDMPGGICPEWACTGCGSALLAGFVLYRADPEFPAELHGQVA